MKNCDVSILLGKTLTECRATGDNEELLFRTTEGKAYSLYHEQDCCESVTIEDICGDLADLIGSPLLMAEEVSSLDNFLKDKPLDKYDDSFTWTFYKFATIKGSVTVRWYGTSNGYYSESVDFAEISK